MKLIAKRRTSGIAALRYDDFVCKYVGAKDSYSPSFAIIQGTKGYIKLNSHCRDSSNGKKMI